MASLKRLPMPLQEEYEWQYEGACREADPATFFSPEFERGRRREARENAAKSFCRRCPVIEECLQHALKAREPYGVWGGLTTGERNEVLAMKLAS